MKNKLSENIKEYRKELGILQENIAKAFNVRQSTISNLENRVDVNSFIRYIAYLRKEGVDLNKLFDSSILECRNKKE